MGLSGALHGDAQSAVDIATFWNILAANIRVRFVDRNHLDRYKLVVPNYYTRLRTFLADKEGHLAQPCVIWTAKEAEECRSIGPTAARRPGQCLSHRSGALGNSEGFVRRPAILGDESALGVEVDARVTFALPNRPYSTDSYFHNQQLIISVSPSEPTLGPDKRHTFSALPAKAQYRLRQSHGDDARPSPRVEPGRLGLVVHATDHNVAMRAMPIWDQARQFSMRPAWLLRLSNGGLITQQLIAQLGGLEGGRVFKVPGVRRLIRTYGPAATFTRDAAIKIIGERDPENPAAFVRGSPQPLHRATRHANVANAANGFLLSGGEGVFRMGWDLKCPTCSLSDWTAIDQVRQQHVCACVEPRSMRHASWWSRAWSSGARACSAFKRMFKVGSRLRLRCNS